MKYERFLEVAPDWEKVNFELYCRNRHGLPEELFEKWFKQSWSARGLKETIKRHPEYDDVVDLASVVHKPEHYQVVAGVEAKDIIHAALEGLGHIGNYQAWCLGNLLKYRLRAGEKDDVLQDIAKADKFKEMFNEG